MSNKRAEIAYLIEMDFGHNGGKIQLEDMDELDEWIKTESDYWSWLNKNAGDRSVGHIAQQQCGTYSTIRSHMQTYRGNQGRPDFLHNIKKGLQSYKEGRTLHSSAKEAELIKLLREESGDLSAIAALGVRIGAHLELQQFEVWQGAIAMVLFAQGVNPKSAMLVKKSLGKIENDVRAHHAEYKQKSKQTTDRLNDLVTSHTMLESRGATAIASATKQARRRADEQRAESERRLQDLEELYKAQLALRAPVDYWNEKRRKHSKSAIVLFSAFVIYIALAVLVGLTALEGSSILTLEFWQGASLGFSALSLMVVGLSVALGRVLLRLAMSQLHLSNDADERVTMVNTYLALREGDHANHEHMKIVLERLFAPTSDGIVKEDFAAVTALDAASSFLPKR